MLVNVDKAFEKLEKKEIVLVNYDGYSPIIEIPANLQGARQFLINIANLKCTNKDEVDLISLYIKIGEKMNMVGKYTKENLTTLTVLCKEFASNGVKLINFDKYDASNVLSLVSVLDYGGF